MSRSPAHSSVRPVPNTGLSQGLVGLASGLDALYLSGRTELSPHLLTVLDSGREYAGESGSPVEVQLGGTSWDLASHGWQKYRYCLDHPRGRLGITPSRQLPTLRFQARAEALHGLGPVAVIDWIAEVVGEAVGESWWSVSRVDLFSDWQGWTLQGDDRHRFVCRASVRKTYEDSDRFTGFEFGARGSGTYCARIYDKTLDIERKGADWWPDVWGDAYNPSETVHRVEFEIGREALRQFGLDSPASVLDGAPSLWRYATEDWLSWRTPTEDQTRSRWPVSPEWLDVQSARLEGAAIGLERTLDGRRRGSLRKLMPGLNGYLVGFAAHTGCVDIGAVAEALPRALRDYELVSHRRFEDRVAERSRELRAG